MFKSTLNKIYLKAKKHGLFEFMLLALLLFSARSAIADWNWVPSGSMLPTIQEGELVWVNKIAYDLKIPFTTTHIAQWGNPQRGDIVVFYQPNSGRRLVKRVIGLPGDKIEMVNEQLYINGQAIGYTQLHQQNDLLFFEENLSESHPHQIRIVPEKPALRNFDAITISADHYFMMGDNRDESADSRVFGLVPRNNIVGKANAIVISLNKNHYYEPRFTRFFSALT